MKHIQTIENLYLKAKERYEKSARLYEHEGGKFGEAAINGRMSHYFGHKGELEEKYNVTIMDVEGKPRLYLIHWGTTTLVIELDTKELLKFYGESVSDRDSMNTMLSLLGMPGKFRFFPSRDEFVYEVDDETEKLKNNVFEIDTLSELENDLETENIFDYPGYLFGDFGTTELSDIVEEAEYQGFTLDMLIELTKNGYGGSVWTLYHIKKENIYLLLDNLI